MAPVTARTAASVRVGSRSSSVSAARGERPVVAEGGEREPVAEHAGEPQRDQPGVEADVGERGPQPVEREQRLVDIEGDGFNTVGHRLIVAPLTGRRHRVGLAHLVKDPLRA